MNEKQELLRLLRGGILRSVPRGEEKGEEKGKKKFGVLFSGGLDSTLLAWLCKEEGLDFACYTAAVEEAGTREREGEEEGEGKEVRRKGEGEEVRRKGLKEAEDLRWARRVAADLGFELRVKTVGVAEVEEILREVVLLFGEEDVVKVSVALPFLVGCRQAREDGVKTLLYGLGAEELFAGYARHRRVRREDLNKECRAGLAALPERDLYRDWLVAKAAGISLRAPFLAEEFVEFALRLPASCKLSTPNGENGENENSEDKVILREIARDLGLGEVAGRKKRAVQYGSNFLKALEKLAKRNGFKYKRDYLRSFFPPRNLKLGCLFSSGKDSAFALWLTRRAGCRVVCLVTVKSRNPNSYLFHTPAVELAELQAEAVGLPLVLQETAGEKEAELEDLRAALRTAKARHGVEGVVTGALWSSYQKERFERVASEENLKVFSPLWHCNQETELRLAVANFEVIFTSVAAQGLDKSWLGRRITAEDVERLAELNKKIAKHFNQTFLKFGGINVAGEGGEFESLVLDGPKELFKKRLVVLESEVVEEDENTARLVVKKARLEEKVKEEEKGKEEEKEREGRRRNVNSGEA